ncbi:hypothetical protein ABK040_010010 [Willaertia magna]
MQEKESKEQEENESKNNNNSEMDIGKTLAPLMTNFTPMSVEINGLPHPHNQQHTTHRSHFNFRNHSTESLNSIISPTHSVVSTTSSSGTPLEILVNPNNHFNLKEKDTVTVQSVDDFTLETPSTPYLPSPLRKINRSKYFESLARIKSVESNQSLSSAIPIPEINVQNINNNTNNNNINTIVNKEENIKKEETDKQENKEKIEQPNENKKEEDAETNNSFQETTSDERSSIDILNRESLDKRIHAGIILTNDQIRERIWTNFKKTNLLLSICNLLNDILTPATVGIGYMTAKAGFLGILLSLIFFGIITIITLCMLYELANQHKATSFPDLMFKAFGKLGLIFISFFVFLFNFSGVITDMIEFGAVVPDLLYDLFGESNIFISKKAVLIYFTIILLPIASMRHLSSFAYNSFVAIGSVIIISFLIFIELVMGRRHTMPSEDSFYPVRSQFLSSLGSLAFIFVCHDVSFEVIGSLRNNTRKRYYTVVIIVITLAVVTLSFLGLCSYFLFYDNNLKDANILNLLPKSYNLAIVGRIFLVICIALSIPYTCFMPRLAMTSILKIITPKLFKTKLNRKLIHYTLTLIVVLLAFVVSILVDNLGIVLELSGSISGTIMAYIIPSILFLKLEKFGEENDEVLLNNENIITPELNQQQEIELNETMPEEDEEEEELKKTIEAIKKNRKASWKKRILRGIAWTILLIGIAILLSSLSSIIYNVVVAG